MTNAHRLVRVWDTPVRLFHWLVVALVAAAYATWRLNWMVWHGWIGELLLALLLFRLLWGFFRQRDGAIFPLSRLAADGLSNI